MDNSVNTCYDNNNSASVQCSDDNDFKDYDGMFDEYWEPGNHNDTDNLAQSFEKQYGVDPGHRAYHLYDEGFAGGNYSTSLHKIGAKALALQDYSWDLGEDDVVVIGDKDVGYSDALTTVWWNDVVANSDLLLSSPVVGIDTSGDHVIVTTENGDLHAANQVIVTVSIGVLQAEIIDFTPDLPASTVSAYNGIGIDIGMKVAMRFSTKWWETEGPLGWLVTEGLAAACWVPTDYKNNTPDNILMCYSMGDNGTTLNNIADAAGGGAAGDAAIVSAMLADLDVVLPQAQGRASATYLGDSIVQNWGAAPYTRGVYSFPIIGTFTGNNNKNSKRLDLQVAVANNRIFFAGEGSNNTQASTVPGALHEGERAAKKVAQVNGNPNNPPPSPVPDTTAPVITLNGNATMSVDQYSTFNDPGATALDNRDGNISGSIQVSGSVDTDILGVHIITYTVSDAAGNSDSATLTVTVSEYVDTVAPVITLIGASSITLDFEEAYVEQGATADDNDDGDITANIVTSGTVDSSTSGNYTITYTVYDAAGNLATETRSVTVGPEPGITLIPSQSVYAPGEAIVIEFTEGSGSNKDWIGVYPADKVPAEGDGNAAEADITLWSYTNGTAGTITNWQNSSILPVGNYVAILFSNDSYNFYGEFGYFSVANGPDVTAPVISLSGGSSISVVLNSTFTDPGATAIDNQDGDVSSSIQVSGSVNTSILGTYTLNYSVTDAAGNSATATRTVTVLDVQPDTVTVKKAEFKNGELKVEASSSDGISLTLTVVGFGVMPIVHSDHFHYKESGFNASDIPSQITVISSNGGTATLTVNFK